MKNHDRIHTRKHESVDERKAFSVGGGIAGLAAAAFPADGIHMPDQNMTIFNKMNDAGGAKNEVIL